MQWIGRVKEGSREAVLSHLLAPHHVYTPFSLRLLPHASRLRLKSKVDVERTHSPSLCLPSCHIHTWQLQREVSVCVMCQFVCVHVHGLLHIISQTWVRLQHPTQFVCLGLRTFVCLDMAHVRDAAFLRFTPSHERSNGCCTGRDYMCHSPATVAEYDSNNHWVQRLKKRARRSIHCMGRCTVSQLPSMTVKEGGSKRGTHKRSQER